MRLKAIIYYLFIGTMFFTSCDSNPQEKKKAIIGTYAFNYPSGEVEVVRIIDESVYIKDVYNTLRDYQNKSKPKYTNQGKWKVDEENNLGIGLIFYGWLELTYSSDLTEFHETPRVVTMGSITWEQSRLKGEEYLWVFDESGYVFKKVKE